MASKKPKIGFGPITDDLADALIKILTSSQSVKKKANQANRIVGKLEKRGGTFTKEKQIITKPSVKRSAPKKKGK